MSKNNKGIEIMPIPKRDRRLLAHVPDPGELRKTGDRRGSGAGGEQASADEASNRERLGRRYEADFSVVMAGNRKKRKRAVRGKAVDISSTGMLVAFEPTEAHLIIGQQVDLRFRIPLGTIPENTESAVRMKAELVRMFTEEQGGEPRLMLAFAFAKPLSEYFRRKRWGSSGYTIVLGLFVAFGLYMLIHGESIVYFRYNLVLYIYSLVTAVYVFARYLFGAMYKRTPVDRAYTPSVSIIVPSVGEDERLERTILSCVDQDYPVDKLEVLVVTNRSSAGAMKRANDAIARLHAEAGRFFAKERVRLHVIDDEGGKRAALAQGAELAKHPLVVFVEAGSCLEPDAVRHLVQPFRDPRMGGTTGRVEAANRAANAMTRLQAVRGYYADRIVKAGESLFDSVTWLSGKLSCYRRELVLTHKKAWLAQKHAGASAGDDRSLTTLILRTHRTVYQDSAICRFVVPLDKRTYMQERMEAKRIWLRESFRASGIMWRKEPFMALFFYMGMLLRNTAPLFVVFELVFMPIARHFFPFSFLLGLLAMTAVMALAQLLLGKSRMWLQGLAACLFFETVLLWQMPVAWVTFWKFAGGSEKPSQLIEAAKR